MLPLHHSPPKRLKSFSFFGSPARQAESLQISGLQAAHIAALTFVVQPFCEHRHLFSLRSRPRATSPKASAPSGLDDDAIEVRGDPGVREDPCRLGENFPVFVAARHMGHTSCPTLFAAANEAASAAVRWP